MTLSKTPARAIVGATLTAAVMAAVLTSAAPAGAVTQTTGCSAWARVPTTRYHLRECAGMVRTNGHKMLRETIYVKNKGANPRHMSGEFMVSWGQAGTGESFTDDTVAPGTTMDITKRFPMTVHATYKAAARITVDGHNSPTVHTNVDNS